MNKATPLVHRRLSLSLRTCLCPSTPGNFYISTFTVTPRDIWCWLEGRKLPQMLSPEAEGHINAQTVFRSTENCLQMLTCCTNYTHSGNFFHWWGSSFGGVARSIDRATCKLEAIRINQKNPNYWEQTRQGTAVLQPVQKLEADIITGLPQIAAAG